MAHQSHGADIRRRTIGAEDVAQPVIGADGLCDETLSPSEDIKRHECIRAELGQYVLQDIAVEGYGEKTQVGTLMPLRSEMTSFVVKLARHSGQKVVKFEEIAISFDELASQKVQLRFVSPEERKERIFFRRDGRHAYLEPRR